MKCKHCDFVTASIDNLREHSRKKHNTAWKDLQASLRKWDDSHFLDLHEDCAVCEHRGKSK